MRAVSIRHDKDLVPGENVSFVYLTGFTLLRDLFFEFGKFFFNRSVDVPGFLKRTTG